MATKQEAVPVGFWNMVMKFTSASVIALCATVIYHEVRLSVIEGNRFTQEDGHALDNKIRLREDAMNKVLWEIRRDVAVIREKVESVAEASKKEDK